MIGIIAVIGLVVGGLALNQSLRPAQAGPLGWDHERIEKSLRDGKIDLCNLDQNFYLSVGIAPPEEADEGCTSWVEDVRAGRAFIQIDVLDSSIRKNPEYRTDSAENMSGQGTHQWRVAGHTRTGEAEKCLAFSNHPMMSNVAITSESSCVVLTPMAQQINNLITQYEFADRNFRLLDFS